MSQQDLDLIRAVYAEFSGLAESGGDIAAYVRTYYDPDHVYEPIEEEGSVRGHEALVEWNERWFEAWDEFHAHVDELIEAGDGVYVSCITAGGRGAGSQMSVDQPFFHVFDLRDGKILRMREYTDRREAIAAAGLNSG